MAATASACAAMPRMRMIVRVSMVMLLCFWGGVFLRFGSAAASERGLPRPVRGGCNPRVRKWAGRSVQGSDAVCPGFYFCKNGICFVGVDLQIFSGEGEEVDFAGGVVDFEADVPAVFCGVAVCGCDGGCCEDFCDDVVVGGAGGGGDGDCADGLSEGVEVFDGGFVVFGGGTDAVDCFACGHVVGCAEGVVFGFEGVEGGGGGDGGGEGAFCGFYGAGGGEVCWHDLVSCGFFGGWVMVGSGLFCSG